MSKRIWSAYQQAVFQDIAEGKGHTVVRARAGAAKTSTIVEGFNYVPRGKTVAMFAFNKSIAKELSEKAPPGVEVSTLHGYGFKSVKRAFPGVRVDANNLDGFTRAAYGDERESWDKRRNLAKLVSLAKANLAWTAEEMEDITAQYDIDVPSTEKGRDEFHQHAAAILASQRDVKNRKAIDFDDMIWLPVVLGLHVWKYDRVFIDETQDLNSAQIALALMAVKAGGRITAVGDDRQAIYGFRGADSNAIENVITALNAKVMPLSICYRCGKNIVALAKQTVPDFEHHEGAIDGLIAPLSKEAMLQDARPGDFILSRTNAPLIGLCLAFIGEGRRANIQGRDVGQSLKAVTKRGAKECSNVLEFAEWLGTWSREETDRLTAQNRPTQIVEDKYECLSVLLEGARSIAEVDAKIDALFSDDAGEGKIVLSTTHKAKGLERDRVFVLENTYRKRPGIEEENLWYVAVTRAREELYLVNDSSWETKKRKVA